MVIVCLTPPNPTSLPFFITPSGDLNKPKYWRSPWLNYRVKTTPSHPSKSGEELEWIIDNASKSSGRTPSWVRTDSQNARVPPPPTMPSAINWFLPVC